jgi:hypothetical protein
VNRLEDIFQRAVQDLERTGHRAALIGGLAVSVRCEPRFTRDVDLAVHVTGDADAEALVRNLIASRYRIEAMIEQDSVGRLATARLTPCDEDSGAVVVDLLFASSGIEPEIVEQATLVEIWPGIHGHVARAGHLIALKLLSRDPRARPKDQVDLMALLAVADPEECMLALDAVALIERRGFARGRALGEDLRALLRDEPR